MLHILELKQLQVGTAPPLNLAVKSGECLVIDGPSGSGKSRLLRAIADLDQSLGLKTLNSISSNDIPPNEWRQKVGLLAAEPVWWAETVADHFAADWQHAERIGIAPALFGQPIQQLSSGERQRMALLRAINAEPQILLLDEPTSQLDERNTLLVEALLTELLDRKTVGIIWVSHDEAQRSRLAGRSLRLSLGEVAT